MRTELYWITGPWPGRVAIMPRPRGGDWLDDEIRGWRIAGVDVVVSALEAEEIEELDLGQETAICKADNVEYASCPIADRGVPASLALVATVVADLEGKLRNGKNVAIHCRQGIGRSSLLAACLLTTGGVPVEEAFARIQQARGRPVPDTEDQRNWVKRFARDTLVAHEAGQ